MKVESISTHEFAPVAQRVQRRVALRRWFALLEHTVWPVSVALVLMMLWCIRGGLSALLLLWGAWVAWQLGCLVYSWVQRPGEFSALALWDAAAGRREAFASAWWFEMRAEESEGARVHVESQLGVLPGALRTLPQDLPLRPGRWLILPLVLALLGSLISAVNAPHVERTLMDEKMTAQAAHSAQDIAQMAAERKTLAGLKEDEQQKVEDLKTKLAETATELASAAGKDARDVLAELEKRAREAEKLAEELGKGKEAWASEKLVEALRKHADTADLGDAVAAKNTAASALAADELAKQLQAKELTPEEHERLKQALKDVQGEADKQDRQRMVGQHVLGAGDEMEKGQSAAAGKEFEKLADKMREMSLREQSMKELQKLAEQLRAAGSKIAGQEQSAEAMQQIGQAGQEGQDGQQSTPQVGQAGQQQQQLAPPGVGQQGQQNQMQPQNGQGQQGQQQQQQQQMMMGQQGQQGQSQQGQQGQQGQPMLVAPVPGQQPSKPDPNSPIMIMPNQQPNEGQGNAAAVALPGGRDPGNGKADLKSTPTEKQTVTGSQMVQAQQNAEGQSTMRSVEGGVRSEQSTRSATQTALDAIQTEESALDESTLPAARREQVRRYFHELRKRFEGEKK